MNDYMPIIDRRVPLKAVRLYPPKVEPPPVPQPRVCAPPVDEPTHVVTDRVAALRDVCVAAAGGGGERFWRRGGGTRAECRRALAWWLMRNCYNLVAFGMAQPSLSEIAAATTGNGHSTVIYALRRVSRMIAAHGERRAFGMLRNGPEENRAAG